MKKIDSFKGEYSFLSNYYECNITYSGFNYTNAEAAFQACKCKKIIKRRDFEHTPPNIAKRMGRTIELREDWEEVKYNFMYSVVYEKFFQNFDLALRLIATGDAELIEGNTWNDTYWGVCEGVGENNLGKILMKVREQLRETLISYIRIQPEQ